MVNLAQLNRSKHDKSMELGKQYLETQNYRMAIISFKNAERQRPTSAEPHLGLAYVYTELGDSKGALRQLDIGIKKEPDRKDLHVIKAIGLSRNGEREEALRELKVIENLGAEILIILYARFKVFQHMQMQFELSETLDEFRKLSERKELDRPWENSEIYEFLAYQLAILAVPEAARKRLIRTAGFN